MSYNVIVGERFKLHAKRLVKKYPSLKKEIEDLGTALSANPFTGSALAHNCYKIRLSIASKRKR